VVDERKEEDGGWWRTRRLKQIRKDGRASESEARARDDGKEGRTHQKEGTDLFDSLIVPSELEKGQQHLEDLGSTTEEALETSLRFPSHVH